MINDEIKDLCIEQWEEEVYMYLCFGRSDNDMKESVKFVTRRIQLLLGEVSKQTWFENHPNKFLFLNF